MRSPTGAGHSPRVIISFEEFSMTSSGPEHTPNGPGQPPHEQPGHPGQEPAPAGRVRSGFDRGKLRMADYAVAAGTLLFLIVCALPWYSSVEVAGVEFDLPEAVNGLDFGSITFAFLLLLLASAWALLPAVTDVAVPFPRAFVTVVLAVLAFLLTFIEWLSDLDAGFSLTGFLALLAAAAVLAFAVLRLLPDLRGSTVPGGLSGAANWANQPAPQPGQQGPSGQQSGGYGRPAPQQPAPWGQPPAHGQPPAYGQPAYGQQAPQQAPWAAGPGERPSGS